MLPVASGPALLSINDFDGDQKSDFVVTAYKTHTVYVVRGNGDGTFAAAVPYVVGTAAMDAEGVASSDLTGDGKPDILVSNPVSTALTVLKNDGAGGFAVQTPTYSTGEQNTGVFVADLDNDGKLDAAVSLFSGNMAVLLGNGDGSFGAVTSLATPLGALGDFNGDGKLDVAGALFSGPDMAPGHVAAVVLGQGNGGFTLPGSMSQVGTSPAGMTTGDFDRDGRLDLAVVNFNSNDVTILLGNGDGTFTAAPSLATGTGPNGVAAADFNCDGFLDLVVTNAGTGSTTVSVFLGTGDGKFMDGVPFEVGAGPGFPRIGDFNGDHAPDVLLNRYSSDVVVLLLNG
jgi:hypothetical protein